MVFLKPFVLEFLKKLAEYESVSNLNGTGNDIAEALSILSDKAYGWSSDNIDEFKHILSPRIFRYIKYILSKKEIPKLTEYLSNPQVKLYNQLREIWGVGPVAAESMINDYGVKSLRDLKSKYVLTETQELGLKYFADINTPIPRKEAESIIEILKGGPREICVCGSFRRGKKVIKDLDILIVGITNPTAFRDYLYSAFKRVEIFNFKNKKMTVLVQLSGRHNRMRHIDFRYVRKSDLPTAMLYFTGNAIFNRVLRQRAKRMNYKLSEYGLFPGKSNSKITGLTTEEAVFKKLRLKYIEPRDRSFTLKSKFGQFAIRRGNKN